MARKKSSQSPTKSGSTRQATTPPASWTDADVDVLLDLAIAHKVSAGEGMNFKATFWNTASAALSNPARGGPKTARLRKMFEVIDCIKNTSGFAYSNELGANIGLENEAVWSDFVKKHKDAGPFRNRGWPHYEKMKQLMPSKGKGLNAFSALSLVGTTGATRLSSSSDSESRSESINTMEGPSVHEETTPCGTGDDVEMTQLPGSTDPSHVQMQPPRLPSSAFAMSPAWPSSVISTRTQATSNWHLQQDTDPPSTPLFLRPPTPSSCTTSAISSIKPSSSVSQKQRADNDDSMVASSWVTSSSGARKRRVKTDLKAEALHDLGQKLDNFKDNFEKSYDNSSNSTPAKPIIPIHPVSRRARDRFLDVDVATVTPAEFTRFLDLLVEDVVIADTYLSISRDPDRFIAGRNDWIQKRLEERKNK
ncbi:hypothetical protein BKA83DRAFT_4487937 [Pisolithus microcarpus]|nr:hypothetical protein BKA83DRAFT_4487937 [Pisolithus microcarpus]